MSFASALVLTLCCDAALAIGPIDAGANFTAEAQWKAMSCTPKLKIGREGTLSASAVVIGQKGGEAYLLTASHSLDDSVEWTLEFYNRRSYYTPARVIKNGFTIIKNAGADFAVIRFVIGSEPVPQVPLARWDQRPKRFPVDALTVGCGGGLPPKCEGVSILGRRLAQKSTDQFGSFWEVDRVPMKGRSGGPIIDKNGFVIGLCAATTGGKGFYTHLDEILAGLKSSEKTRWLLNDEKAK